MNDLQLFINDQLVDLSDDSPIALSFQINNLADVQNQQGNTSNQFKLPLTQRNRQLLGFADEPAFTTKAPYRKYAAKLVQDGLEIIPNAIAELNNIEQDGANITVLSGNVDFFDAIDGKIYDMGDSTSIWTNYGKLLVWKSYDHTWNLDNVVNSQTKTDGWIWPVVDYGFFDADNFDQPIDVRNTRPGFFIKTAIDLLLQSAGYKGAGSLLNDSLYPLLICQFANGSFDHGTDYQSDVGYRGLVAKTGLDISANYYGSSTHDGYIPFSVIQSDPSHSYVPASDGYFAAEITDTTILFSYSLQFMSTNPSRNPGISSKLQIQIVLFNLNTPTADGVAIATTIHDFAGRGDGSAIIANNQKLSVDHLFQQGENIKIVYTFLGASGGSFVMTAGATLTVTEKIQQVQFGQTVQCERILPDISQKDFLKDTLQRFGVVCQTDNATQTISFNSFRDIVNNIPIAKNWTSKCVDQGKQVYFQLGNYSQVNYMQYKADDNILPAKYGWSQINIDDQTLPASGTLFESQFGASLTQPWHGGTVAQIKMHDNTQDGNDLSIGVAPRILIDQKFDLRTINQSVTFTDGTNQRVVNGIISTPYFAKPDAPLLNIAYGQANLLYDDLRKRYYPELEKILTQAKKVIRYLMLTPRDILELDLLIPIFLEQDGAYYYINKIDSWRKGQPCKVELVKLG